MVEILAILAVIVVIAFVHSGKRRQATAEEKQAMADAKKSAVRRAMGESPD